MFGTDSKVQPAQLCGSWGTGHRRGAPHYAKGKRTGHCQHRAAASPFPATRTCPSPSSHSCSPGSIPCLSSLLQHCLKHSDSHSSSQPLPPHLLAHPASGAVGCPGSCVSPCGHLSRASSCFVLSYLALSHALELFVRSLMGTGNHPFPWS